MACLPGSLQEIANPGSNFTWVLYAFATNDPLETALKPGYFNHWAFNLQPGDMIVFGCNRARPGFPAWGGPTPVRRALLMVTAVEQGRVSVWVAQDWGGVEAGPAVGQAG